MYAPSLTQLKSAAEDIWIALHSRDEICKQITVRKILFDVGDVHWGLIEIKHENQESILLKKTKNNFDIFINTDTSTFTIQSLERILLLLSVCTAKDTIKVPQCFYECTDYSYESSITSCGLITYPPKNTMYLALTYHIIMYHNANTGFKLISHLITRHGEGTASDDLIFMILVLDDSTIKQRYICYQHDVQKVRLLLIYKDCFERCAQLEPRNNIQKKIDGIHPSFMQEV